MMDQAGMSCLHWGTKSAVPKEARGSTPPLVLMTPPVSTFWGIVVWVGNSLRGEEGHEWSGKCQWRWHEEEKGVSAVSLRLLVLLFLLLTSLVIIAWSPLICRVGMGAQDPWRRDIHHPLLIWWTASSEDAAPISGGNKMQPLSIFKA